MSNAIAKEPEKRTRAIVEVHNSLLDLARSFIEVLKIAQTAIGISFAQSSPYQQHVGSSQRSHRSSMSSFDFDTELLSHTLEHRGCGVRAASYEVQPQSWLPEACVWLQTDHGHRKIWVRSFAHCFAAEDLTFSNRFDADSWALGAAKTIIDKALESAEELAVSRLSQVFSDSMSKLRRSHRHRPGQ